MNFRWHMLGSPTIVKVIAAIIIGFSVGTLLQSTPVMVPMLGAVPGIAVGGVGFVVGVVLYRHVPTWLAPAGCSCSGDCGCT